MSEPQATLKCDNYATCRSSMWSQGEWGLTTSIARAKGWHIFDGETIGGKPMSAILCPQCVGTNRSRLPKALDVLSGQLELEVEE